MIDRGVEILDRAIRLDRPGPLQIQAAINALHAEASVATETDWEQIELLYRRLRSLAPTPVVELNHAVAVAMVDGAAAGLRLLDDPALATELDRYSHFHAARGRLLADVGDRIAATAAYERALETVRNDIEREFLTDRLCSLGER